MDRRFLLLLAAAALFAGVHGALAQTDGTSTPQNELQISYPISELGGCSSQSDCKTYCNANEHQDACLEYAQEHNLMSPAQVNAAKQVLRRQGPGGCSDSSSCKAYCSDAAHVSECASFGQKTGLIATSTAILVSAISTTGGPGGCTSASECKLYCQVVSHATECQQFAQKNGQKQSQIESKISEVLKSATGPGGCTDAASCKAYCDDSSHGDECRSFAVEHGIMSQSDFARIQVMASSTGPGGCKGTQCVMKCSSDASLHGQCLNYAVSVGLISQSQASTTEALQSAIESSGGPGGCSSLQECKTYCSDATHKAECMTFASEHGIIALPQNRNNQNAPGSNAGSQSGLPGMYMEGSSTLPSHPRPRPGTASSTSDERPSIHVILPPQATGSAPASNPPPPTATEPSASGSAPATTKVICNTIEQCKELCGTNTGNCQYIPLPPPPTGSIVPSPAPSSGSPATGNTLTPVPNSTQTIQPADLGAAVANTVFHFFGF